MSLGHIAIDAWTFGLVDRARVRLDKVTGAELRAFAHCPATRFLSSLTLHFTDQNDNAIAKVQVGRRKLEDIVAVLKNAPCADSLRVVHVRSIDPDGQPAAVMKEKTVWAREALRRFRCLTDCRLSFDSEP
ncbi:MAG: hypothetical protein Q8K32_22540 [Archangium sp.]|nr:hypothetical protein [Archangium sp.]